VQYLGQKPQDRNVGKQTCAGGYMILKHPFKIFDLALLASVVPGPEIIEHIVIYYGKFDGYKAG
jgi:hypothetical protein